MKKLPSALLFVLVFCGCSNHPKEGDWYEAKRDGLHVKIEFVGYGRDANKFATEMCETMNKATSTRGYTVAYLHYNPDDSLNTCVEFSEETSSIAKMNYMVRYKVIDLESFLQNYKLIE
jgi:PBP1b-binding outer membrane lipoprotein LpoB